MHPDLEREFPPLRSLDAFRHNLPLQLSPLIGRGPEIAAVVDLLSALEGLGAAAAASDSSAEALRLLGAADRLRDETGYRWRFPVEQTSA